MEKGGQGIQFNWIFIIIAGGLILIFFMFFINNYYDLHKLKVGSETARGLDQVFLSAKSTPQYKNFDLKGNEFDLNFECGFFVVNDEYRQETDYVVFGEDLTEVSELVIWSKEFKKPFNVENVLYVLDVRKKVYVEGNLDFLKGFPEDIEVVSNVNDAELVVFFDYCPPGYENKKKVCIVDDKIIFENNVYPYYDDILVYAILFSDLTSFECGVTQLENKWSNLFKIYSKKIDFMSGCSSHSNILKSELDSALSQVLSGEGIFNEEEIIYANRNLANLGCGVVF